MQLIGYSLCLDKRAFWDKDVYLILNFLKPLLQLYARLRTYQKLGFTRTHNVREGVRLMRDAVKRGSWRLNDKWKGCSSCVHEQNKRLRKFRDRRWAKILNFFQVTWPEVKFSYRFFFVILLNLFVLLYLLLISITFSTTYVIFMVFRYVKLK